MNKIVTPNLGLIITEKCNMNCKHCLQGQCSNKVMNDNIIENALDQFKYIENLTICGGEPTLSLDRIEKVFSYIIENKILVYRVQTIINGTIYSEEFLRLLNQMESYLNPKSTATKTIFAISYDKYHKEELERLKLLEQYLENVKKYTQSKYFCRFQTLGNKVFREGNAEKLDLNQTVPMTPMPAIMTYVGKRYIGNWCKFDKEKGLCHIGPSITINPDGIVTECDASNEHQITLYNYGNILTESIEDITLRRAKILKPHQFNSKVNREIIKYGNLLR